MNRHIFQKISSFNRFFPCKIFWILCTLKISPHHYVFNLCGRHEGLKLLLMEIVVLCSLFQTLTCDSICARVYPIATDFSSCCVVSVCDPIYALAHLILMARSSCCVTCLHYECLEFLDVGKWNITHNTTKNVSYNKLNSQTAVFIYARFGTVHVEKC
jgi:hypothetical protein